MVLGRSTAVGDSGDVFTGVVAVNKTQEVNKTKTTRDTNRNVTKTERRWQRN